MSQGKNNPPPPETTTLDDISKICMKFGHLIHRKLLNLLPPDVKFDFGWGCAPDPAGEAYSIPPDLLARLRGHTSKGRGRKRGREWSYTFT